MGTPHNAAEKGQIAKIVLMAGDPLRAKWVAETFLENVECFNTVRGMYGFTGDYQGVRLSVMGHGMGIPSIAIYSYELYHMYDVEVIFRIGSAGGIADCVAVYDIVLAQGACTDSAYASQYRLPGTFAPLADFELLEKVYQRAKQDGLDVKVGNILSSDCFYNDDPTASDRWKSMGVLAVEMEAAALYMNAAKAGKRALTILTVSDHLYTGESLAPEQRQTGFSKMVKLALDTASTL